MSGSETAERQYRNRIIRWLLVFLAMAGIYFLSSQTAPESNALSGKTIRALLLLFRHDFPALSLAEQNLIISSLQSVVRDAAHILVYLLLGILCMLALLAHDGKMKNRILIALIIGTVYAFLDELHQYFVSGRAFEFYDVILDGSGLLLGIMMVAGTLWFRSRKRRSF